MHAMQVLASRLAHLGLALVALVLAVAVHQLTMLPEDRKQPDQLSKTLQRTAGQRFNCADRQHLGTSNLLQQLHMSACVTSDALCMIMSAPL